MATNSLASMGFVACVENFILEKSSCLGCVVLCFLRVFVGPRSGVGRHLWSWYRSGTDPWAMVVLVACTPLVEWSSWWAVSCPCISGPVVHGDFLFVTCELGGERPHTTSSRERVDRGRLMGARLRRWSILLVEGRIPTPTCTPPKPRPRKF